jgi:beta-N-acetylhexosaminidase
VWIVTVLLAGLSLVGRLDDERLEPVARAPGARSDEGSLRPREALGQMIVARFTGSEPPLGFLHRIAAGEIGGVILFGENLEGGETAIGNRVDRLQRAARRGGGPPLLVMVDQEGGKVRRLPGPPTVAPAAMSGRREAREQGEATAGLLRRLGVDVDLAPVADLGRKGSFLGPRAFASSPERVAMLACSFAAGLRHGNVVATLKHFPGLGLANANTDTSAVRIDAPAARIRAGYAPYQACAGAPLTMVMIGSAIYPRLTGNRPAVMSPGTYTRELPLAGARQQVTISDALETPAIEVHPHPARRAIDAGLDLLLYAKSESASAAAYDRLLDDADRHRISTAKIQQAAAAVIDLKRELTSRRHVLDGDPPPGTGPYAGRGRQK